MHEMKAVGADLHHYAHHVCKDIAAPDVQLDKGQQTGGRANLVHRRLVAELRHPRGDIDHVRANLLNVDGKQVGASDRARGDAVLPVDERKVNVGVGVAEGERGDLCGALTAVLERLRRESRTRRRIYESEKYPGMCERVESEQQTNDDHALLTREYENAPSPRAARRAPLVTERSRSACAAPKRTSCPRATTPRAQTGRAA